MDLIEVVCGLIFQEDKVFICRRKAGKHLEGYWEFPGGKLNEGEVKEQALIRELQEELAMKVHIGAYLGYNDHSYSNKRIRLHAIKCELISYEGLLIDHDSAEWTKPDNLKNFKLAPADIPLVKYLPS